MARTNQSLNTKIDDLITEIKNLIQSISGGTGNGTSNSGGNNRNNNKLKPLEGSHLEILKEIKKNYEDISKYNDNLNERGYLGQKTNGELIAMSDGLRALQDNLHDIIERNKTIFSDVDEKIAEIKDDIAKTIELYKTGKEDAKWTEDTLKSLRDALSDQKKIRDQIAKNNEKELNEEAELRAYLNYLITTELKKKREGLTLEETINFELEKRGILTRKISNGYNELKQGFNQIATAVKDFAKAWSEVDKSAMAYARHIGGSEESAKQLRKTAIALVDTYRLGAKYNVSASELVDIQSKYVEAIGRNGQFTANNAENISAIKNIFGDEGITLASNLQSFGIDLDSASDRFGKMFKEASKSGVAVDKLTKNISSNLKIAQNYTFKNGVKDFMEMARKATEIRLEMSQVTRFADKVNTVEGATTAAANLSVLGGPFTAFSNPLAMMRDSLMDPKALQDRIIGMIGGLGHWDNEKGQVDISAFNRQRINAMAEATGMDANNLMESVNNIARGKIVESQLGGYYTDEKDKELLRNVGQVDKDGRAYVNVYNSMTGEYEQKYSEDLAKNPKLLEQIKKQNGTEVQDIKKISQDTRNIYEVLEGNRKQYENIKAKGVERSGLGDKMKTAVDELTKHTTLLSMIAYGGLAGSFGLGLGKIYNGGSNMISGMMGRTGAGVSTAGGPATAPTSPIGGALTTASNAGFMGNFQKGGSMIGRNRILTNARQGKTSWIGRRFTPIGGMKAFGKAAGGGAALGGLISGVQEFGMDNNHTTGQKIGRTVAGTGAGATGAVIGTAIGGPVGAIVGGLIGIGAGWLFNKVADAIADTHDAREKFIKEHGFENIPNIDKLSLVELEELDDYYQNGTELDKDLLAKLEPIQRRNGGFVQPKKYAKGGKFSGKGSDTSDSNLVSISDNEFIVNAKSAKKYSPLLESINADTSLSTSITPINPLKSMIVKPVENLMSNIGPKKIEFGPITINGTIKLDAGNGSTEIDTNKLLNNPRFMNELTNIIAKNIDVQTKFGYDKFRYPLHKA